MPIAARGRYRPDDFRHLALGDTQSTNTDALRLARDGDPGLLWVTAERQLGGRGRRGRPWISEAGNLYASLLLVDPGPVEALSVLPLAVAVAVRKTVVRALPEGLHQVGLKWPNDVLVDRKKVSGILLEAENLPGGQRALVIGCGINVVHKPEAPLYPATCLCDEGSTATAELVFAWLLEAMVDLLNLWDQGRGTVAVVNAWREHALGLGQAITVNLPDRSLTGTFAGIDDGGLLQLRLDDGGVVPIAAGDVFFHDGNG